MVLLSLAEPLLDAADEAANLLQMSRLAYIRLSLIRNLAYFEQHERAQFTEVMGRMRVLD
jgi:hypothetical protein